MLIRDGNDYQCHKIRSEIACTLSCILPLMAAAAETLKVNQHHAVPSCVPIMLYEVGMCMFYC